MRRSRFLTAMLWAGLAFLYVPILSMIVYSFNASRLATVWGGFSTAWYVKLMQDETIIAAAILSLKIAVASATVATVLGTMAAVVLVRFGGFRSRALFESLTIVPLVIPEVIVGIAILMLYVIMAKWIGWPAQRGALTITIAHATLLIAYVVAILRARLTAADLAIEDAAMDLGARPVHVLFHITLPMLAPGIIAAWLLALTLSLDNVVTSNFTTGPGATTLPLLIWSKVKIGVSPDINALASIIVVVVSFGVVIAALIGRRLR